MVRKEEKSLYEVLAVERSASQADIKKAYHKLALKLHPDKNPGDQEANDKFQSLQRIYAVLGAPDKRKVYDQTGSIEDSEELAGEQFDSLYKYYRNIYKQVTEEDIVKVEEEYRGSEEEALDVVKFYEMHKGNMEKVFSWVMCSDPNLDAHRFMDIIEKAIREDKVKLYKSFKQWAEIVVKRVRPKDPFKKRPKARKDTEDSQALVKAIRERGGNSFSNIAAALEAKYGKKSAKNGANGNKHEPTEEEFAAASARISKKRKDEPASSKAAAGKKNKRLVAEAAAGDERPEKRKKNGRRTAAA